MLPDAGAIIYNGVEFSVLFRTQLDGEYLPNNAKNNIKATTWVLQAEGIVTPAEGSATIDTNMAAIRQLLSRPAGTLVYTGRGFNELVVNPVGGGGVRDTSWGPFPKVLHFQPLGNGLSAMVRWQCSFTIPEMQVTTLTRPVMQYSYSYALTYDEEQYTQISLKGILEVPLTRVTVNNRTIPANIVDSFRAAWMNINFDLTKYRITRRVFNESDDGRTCQWEYSVEELPPMDLPPGAVRARGTFDVQPIKTQGQRSMLLLGNIWSCNLRCTYAIRKDRPRRQASIEFFNLLMFRMNASALGLFPGNVAVNTVQQGQQRFFGDIRYDGLISSRRANAIANFASAEVATTARNVVGAAGPAQALLANFSFSEGLYLDSRSMSFEAGWVLFTTFRTILDASGVWRWPADGANGENQNGQAVRREKWATSMQNITGWRSWLANELDPNFSAIVDMGGGGTFRPSPVNQVQPGL